ncbi:hypothetical protein [Shewanella woodyi]|uniref:hypothetical protein n=1 Tax=Shewanella woodyi TaxID=60961 RepID=UPI0012FA6FA4|nr:hypothetical protein [Shewanella woodyi]
MILYWQQVFLYLLLAAGLCTVTSVGRHQLIPEGSTMASVPSTPTVATVLGIYQASLNSKYCDYLCKPSFALKKRGAQKAEGVIVLSFVCLLLFSASPHFMVMDEVLG